MNESLFDYERKVCGATEVRLSPTYMQALKLRYCLEDLEGLSGRVLDIGCGAGNMPRAIKHYRPDLEVWGTDLSTHAVKAAFEDPGGVRFLVCDGEGLPFHDGFFDAVTMFDVFEHFPDPERGLSETHRVLCSSGLLHAFVPLEKQAYTIYALLHRLGWKAKEEHCGHVYFYSDHECKNHMEQAGFEVKKLRWSVHPIYAMVDVAYFTFLSLRGKPVSTSVEGFIHRHNGKPTMTQRFVGLLKNILVAMGYYESLALRRMPGGGGHFTGVKKGK